MKTFIQDVISQNGGVTLAFINGQSHRYVSVLDLTSDEDLIVLETKSGRKHLVRLSTVAQVY